MGTLNSCLADSKGRETTNMTQLTTVKATALVLTALAATSLAPSAAATPWCVPVNDIVCFELPVQSLIGPVSVLPNTVTSPIAAVWEITICIPDLPIEQQPDAPEGVVCDPDWVWIPLVWVTAPGSDPCELFLETPYGCITQTHLMNLWYPESPFETLCLYEADFDLYLFGSGGQPDLHIPGVMSFGNPPC